MQREETRLRAALAVAESDRHKYKAWADDVEKWYSRELAHLDDWRDSFGHWCVELQEFASQAKALLTDWRKQLRQVSKLPPHYLNTHPADFPYYDFTRQCNSWTDTVEHNLILSDVPLWKTMPGIEHPYNRYEVKLETVFGCDDTAPARWHGIWYELLQHNTRAGGAINKELIMVFLKRLTDARRYATLAQRAANSIIQSVWPKLDDPPADPGALTPLPPLPSTSCSRVESLGTSQQLVARK